MMLAVREMPSSLILLILSSSIRASLYECRRTTAGSGPVEAIVPHEPSYPCSRVPVQLSPEGTFDADELLEKVNTAVDLCLRNAGDHAEESIVAVGFDCFAMSWVGCSTDGCAVTPVYSYADQHPSTPKYTAALQEKLSSMRLTATAYQRTGTPVHRAYAAPQMMRLSNEEPQLYASIATFRTFSSYVLSRWTMNPRFPVSYSEASWTGLLDRVELCWYDPAAGRWYIKEKLPEIVDFDDVRRYERLSQNLALDGHL